jgi:TRAP-type C4-dicarboxylate transport system permease small subunit
MKGSKSKLLFNFFDSLNGLIFGLVFVFVVINVISRYGLHFDISWSTELSSFLLIWIGFLGIDVAYYLDEHARLSFLKNKLPKPIRKVVDILVEMLIISVFVLFLYQGLKTIAITINNSPAMNIPMKYVYYCVPISAIVGLIFSIEKIVKYFRRF